MEIRDDVPRKLIGGTSPHDLQYPLTTLQPIAMSFPDAIRREKGHEAAIVAAVETIGKGVTKFGTSPFNLHASEVIHKASRYKRDAMRSEEHTSELQSLMRISYAVFCLKKKNKINNVNQSHKQIINKHHETKQQQNT